MRVLIIGSGAREHAIARAFKRSKQNPDLFCFATSNNPGIKTLTTDYAVGKITDTDAITKYAQKNKIDWAFVGPEAPLEAGVVDALEKSGVPSVGPTKQFAQIETSKSFTRNLLTEYKIPACPAFRYFTTMDGVENFIRELGSNYVVKADGLMGGKGVKVSGDHLESIDEGVAWCTELVKDKKTFLIEEKLIGQEFSLMSFCDGIHLAHTPAVQDHKRAFAGDLGPNTGGMGSYSDADHSLPFLTAKDIEEAHTINQATADALHDKFKTGYKGILYGGFIATKNGVKLIEYNARLADPESMNILAILDSDLVELSEALIKGTLSQNHAQFSHKATVCKYAVPEGYPDNPLKGREIDVAEVKDKNKLYFAAIDERNNKLYETGSRTAAVVGVADTIVKAEKIAEEEVKRIRGPLFHREDIGTSELIQKRVDMMKNLRK